MINATSEANYLYRGLRSLLGFRLAVLRAQILHGHIFRTRYLRDYIDTHVVRKLHLGATKDLAGFLNSQITGPMPIDITKRLPIADDSFDLVFSSHLIEHIHRKECLSFLGEVYRILRPGGSHIIATPSIEKIAKALYGSDTDYAQPMIDDIARFYDDGFITPCHYANLSMRAFGHRFLVDLVFLKRAADQIGYRKTESVSIGDITDTAIQKYLAASKSDRWYMETEIFVLHKP